MVKKGYSRIDLAWLSAGYFFHLWIRMLHDKTYEKVPVYKNYTDKKYTSTIHKATLVAFIAAFAVFYLAQSVLPGLFSFKTPSAKAGASSVSWTTSDDFSVNTTTNQLTVLGDNSANEATNGTLQLQSTQDFGTDQTNDLVLNSGGTVSIDNLPAPYASLSSKYTTLAQTTNKSSSPKTITVASSSGFTVGQPVLIAQMKNASGSGYSEILDSYSGQEDNTVAAINGTTITLTNNLVRDYPATYTQVIQYFQFHNLTISNNTTLKSPGYNGSSGGILRVKISGTLTVDNGSKIDLTGLGYRAKEGPGAGESTASAGDDSTNPAGGGFGGKGGAATYYAGTRQGGVAYGDTQHMRYMGSGGGTQGTSLGSSAGGLVRINATKMVINGSIQSNGKGGTYSPGSGGSSGGGIEITSNDISLATSGGANISAAGGGGGGNAQAGQDGLNGTGGNGQVAGGAPGSPPGNGGDHKGSSPTYWNAGGPSAGGAGGYFRGSGGGGAGRIIINYGYFNSAYVNGQSDGYSSPSSTIVGPNAYYHYQTPLYTTGTISGLNTNQPNQVAWTSLDWNVDWPTTNGIDTSKYNVKFRIRSADDATALASATWFGSSGAVSDNSIWTDNNYFGQTYSGTKNGTVPFDINGVTGLKSTKYAEVEARIESDGLDTPVLRKISLSYDSLEAPLNTNLTFSRTTPKFNLITTTSHGGGAGAANLVTNEDKIYLTATGLTCGGGSSGNNSCQNSSTNREIQVESKLVNQAFDGTNLVTGDYALAGDGTYTSKAIISGLYDQQQYHFRVRTIDAQGRVSGWASYGGNSDGNPPTTVADTDLYVDQQAPKITSITVNGGNNYIPASRIVTVNATFTDGYAPPGSSNYYSYVLSQDGVNYGLYSRGSNNKFDPNSNFGDWPTYAMCNLGSCSGLQWSIEGNEGPKTIYVKIRDNAGNLSDWTQTIDTDFNAGLTRTNVASNSGTLSLASTTNPYAPNYISGLANTALAGKYVYNSDAAGNIAWAAGSYQTSSCTSVFCAIPGTDPLYPSNSTLLSPEQAIPPAFSNSNYPAQNACKTYGGRLPTVAELSAIYAGRITTYGNNFQPNLYWSSTEQDANNAWYVGFSGGGPFYVAKSYATAIFARCVADALTTYNSPGTFESSLYNAGSTNVTYGSIKYTANVPTGAGLQVYVRGGNTINGNGTPTLDASWTSYSASALGSGDSLAAYNNKQYLQYKVLMSGTTTTPTLSDITLETNPYQPTLLDTTIPTGTVKINNNPAYITTNSVKLFLDPSDGAAGCDTATPQTCSGIQDFELSNDGVTWGTTTDANGNVSDSGAWKAWDASAQANYTTGAGHSGYSWNVPSGDGHKKVYAQFRDKAGNAAGIQQLSGFMAGRTGSILDGKFVYTRDVAATDKYSNGNTIGTSTPVWKTDNNGCNGPQCTVAGPVAEQGVYGYGIGFKVLVADNDVNFNPSGNATPDYPSRDACKVLGGRLPTLAEIHEIMTNQLSYGNNFTNGYWSATEASPGSPTYAVGAGTGFGAPNTFTGLSTRCVADSPIYTITSSTILDGTNPSTSITVNPSSPTGDSNWYKVGKPTISLSATDGTGSGVNTLYYQWDSGTVNSKVNTGAAEPFNYQLLDSEIPEGQHTLTYYSIDVAGNLTETHHTQQFKIDIQAPSTGYNISPASPSGSNGWYVSVAPTINLTPTDPNSPDFSDVATTYFQWVNHGAALGNWSTYGAPLTAPQGDKDLYFYTKDNAGNAEAQQHYEIKYNANAPDIPSNFNPIAASPSSITLHWDAVTNDTTGIISYTIQRQNTDGTWQTLIAHNLNGTGCGALDGNATGCTDVEGLDTGFSYKYEIRATDNGGQTGAWSDPIIAYTVDTVAPQNVVNVRAVACDGTINTCATTDSNGNANPKGFSAKVTWNASTDTGVGLSKYLIYRGLSTSATESDWTVIGVVDAASPSGTVYYDNDGSNAATSGADKASASDPLNDSTTYYYRVTAYDKSGNHTHIVYIDPQIDPLGQGNLSLNYPANTPDVTAPTIPGNVIASAAGIDPNPASILPEDPIPTDSNGNPLPKSPILHQRINVSWGASVDYKHTHPNGEVSGNSITYHVLQLKSGSYTEIGTTSNLNYSVYGLQDFTDYSFKIVAVDSSSAHNPADFTGYYSTVATRKTASSAVPTVPTEVTVTTTKGNPNTDSTVGHQATITFFGSYAKNCDQSTNTRCLVKYEVFRSTTNYPDDADWVDPVTGNPVNATKIAEFTPHNIGNDRKKNDSDTPYSVTDTGQTYPAASAAGLTDSTPYYYKVWALDNTPKDPDGGPYYSPMSAVSIGTVHSGWDTTPDATKPQVGSADLKLSVKDTHPSKTLLRNIITWQVIDPALSYRKKQSYENCTELINKPGYCTDFARYEIHREVYDQSGVIIPEMSQTFPITDLNTNIQIDSVDVNYQSDRFKYYILVVDNADYYKDQNGQKINVDSGGQPYAPNQTDKIYWDGSIVPAQASALISNVQVVNPVGVSSATVTWDTNQPTDSLVEFRPKKWSSGNWVIDSSQDFKAIGHRESSSNHSVYLFGLQANTDYEYRVISRNYPFANETVVSDNLPDLKTASFNVNFQPEKTEKSTTSVKLYWTTNMPANVNIIQYKLNDGSTYQSQAENAVNLDNVSPANQNCSATPALCQHSVSIQPLRSSSSYTFTITATSLDGFNYTTPPLPFTTDTNDARQFTMTPSSANVAERNINSTTAQITWQTAVPTKAVLHYGTEPGSANQKLSVDDPVYSTTHVLVITGLVPGTKYYYYIEATDMTPLTYSSPEYSFTAVIKPRISNLQVKDVSPYSVTIAWDTNVDTETVLNWGKTSGYGEKHGTGGTSQVHQVTIDNLDDNTEYHYQIVAHDEAGNEVVGEDAIIRTPLDTEGPKITNVKTDIMPLGDSDTTSQVIISWTTNKPATTLVQYDEGIIGGHYTKASTEDTTLNSSHTVIIKGLSVATTYHYHIVSKDKRNNTTTSNDYTFVTPSQQQSIWNLIVNSLQQTFAWTKNLGNLFKRK